MEQPQIAPPDDGMESSSNNEDNDLSKIDIINLFRGAIKDPATKMVRDSSSEILKSLLITIGHEKTGDHIKDSEVPRLAEILNKIADLPETCISVDSLGENQEAAKLMKDLDVRQIVVINDGDKKRFVIRFNDGKSIDFNGADGCRRVDIEPNVSGTISKTDKGVIVIDNIKGVRATVDCDSDLAVLVGKTVSVDITRASLRTTGDQPAGIEVTGEMLGVEKTVEIVLPDELLRQADHIRKLVCDAKGGDRIDEELRQRVIKETSDFSFLGMSAGELTVAAIISALVVRRQLNRTKVVVDAGFPKTSPIDRPIAKDIKPFVPPPRVAEQLSRGSQNIGKLSPAEFKKLMDSHIRELRENGLLPGEHETLNQFEEKMKSPENRELLQRSLAKAGSGSSGSAGDTGARLSLEETKKASSTPKDAGRPLSPQVTHTRPGPLAFDPPGKLPDKGLPPGREPAPGAKSYERTVYRRLPNLGRVAGACFLAEAAEQAYERFIK
ncbi:MAG: hypothetical protein K2Z81_24230 [Cyanobacteria bacterium]|nr:hypothetical protein [Cyanobacteriota bacterium]